MFIGKKKTISQYINIKKIMKTMNPFDFILSDYLTKNLVVKLEAIGLYKNEVHIDWSNNYKCVGIQSRYTNYFVDIQIYEDEFEIAYDLCEPDNFINVKYDLFENTEAKSLFIYNKIKEILVNANVNIKVKVIFFSNKRISFPQLNSRRYDAYRPHFIVRGTTEYLGIQFEESELRKFNIEGDAIVKKLYTVDYSKLVTGAKFDIVEGSNIVGEGTVL